MKLKYDHSYDDIINLKHHVSKSHPPLSLYARSSQFAPFAALTGYEDAVKETARETKEKIEIDDEIRNILDGKIQLLVEKIRKNPEINITYFVPDLTKDGGSYETISGIVKKIDSYKQCIYLANGTEIAISEIIDISGSIFKGYYM